MRRLALLIAAGLFPFPLYASSFAYEDIASYPRYRVVLTGNRIAESDILDNFDKHGSSSALSIQQQFLNVNPSMSKKNERSVVMMSAHGQPFECTIPDDDNSQEHHDTSTTPSEEDSIERGLKLLEPLSKQNCLYYPTPGYWTYEYCHDKHVRQFHLDRNALQGDQRQISAASNSPSFYLGFYSPSSSSIQQQQQQQQKTDLASQSQHDHSPITSLRHVGDQRYLVQQWMGGTECDLTGKPRSIEIQFHCDMQTNDRISMFQEVATCQYQMTITTPRLCEEMMLASTSHSDVNKIECNPIVPDHLVDDTTRASMDETTTTDHSSSSSSAVFEDEATTSMTTTTTSIDTATDTATTTLSSTLNQQPLDMDQESLMNVVADLKAQLQELRQQVQQQQRHDRSATTLSQLEHLLRVEGVDEEQVEYLIYQFDENGQLVSAEEGGGFDALFNGQQREQQEEEDKNEEGSQKQNRRAYEMRYL